jgi:hypothetical protein
MKDHLWKQAAIGAAAIMAMAGGCRTVMPPQERQDMAQIVIMDWAEPARLLAADLIDEYGPPDRVESSRLVWNNKHLWKKITVWDDIPGSSPDDGGYILEQTVSYPVPAQKLEDLAAFSGELRVSADGTELSARSISEDRDYLAVNLADEIVQGIKTPEEARQAYDQILRLKQAGKTSAMTQGFNFLPNPLP